MLWSMLNEAHVKDSEREHELQQMMKYVQSLHSGSESELLQWSELANEYQRKLGTVSARLAESEHEAAHARAEARRVRRPSTAWSSTLKNILVRVH